jgi:hypothetical protein
MRHANEPTDRHTASHYALTIIDIMQGKHKDSQYTSLFQL